MALLPVPYFIRVAVNSICGTLASALDSGQSRFAALAICWNLASSMPGTLAFKVRAIRSIKKAITLRHQPHGRLRVYLFGSKTCLVAGKREGHGEAGCVCGTQQLFRVGAFAVVFKTAAKAVRVGFECGGFSADLALAFFTLAFPMNAGGFFSHGVSFMVVADSDPIPTFTAGSGQTRETSPQARRYRLLQAAPSSRSCKPSPAGFVDSH